MCGCGHGGLQLLQLWLLVLLLLLLPLLPLLLLLPLPLPLPAGPARDGGGVPAALLLLPVLLLLPAVPAHGGGDVLAAADGPLSLKKWPSTGLHCLQQFLCHPSTSTKGVQEFHWRSLQSLRLRDSLQTGHSMTWLGQNGYG